MAKGRRYNCFARTQMRYMLGGAGTSYVVGFGKTYSKFPQIRGASCPGEPFPGKSQVRRLCQCDMCWFRLLAPTTLGSLHMLQSMQQQAPGSACPSTDGIGDSLFERASQACGLAQALSKQRNPHTATGALVEQSSFSDALSTVRGANDSRAAIEYDAGLLGARMSRVFCGLKPCAAGC